MLVDQKALLKMGSILLNQDSAESKAVKIHQVWFGILKTFFKSTPRRELLRDLSRKQPMLAIANVSVAACLVLGLAGHVSTTYLLLWFGYILCVQLARLITWRSKILGCEQANINEIEWWLIVWSFAAGLGWGLTTPLFVLPGDTVHLLLISLVVAGVAAGAMAVLPAYPLAFYAFVLPTLLPHIVRLGFGPEPIALAAGLVGLIYLIFILIAGHHVHRSLSETAAYQAENSRLIDELQMAHASLQREMQTRSAELTTLLDIVPASIWIVHDLEANQVTVSRFAQEFLRLPAGINHSLAAPVEQRPRHFHIERNGRIVSSADLPFERAARGFGVSGQEQRICFSDGSYVDELISCAPVFDGEGEIVGAVGTSIDITARRAVEEALQQSEQRFRDFANSASNWLWETDAEHRFVWISSNFQKLSGLSREDLYGNLYFQFFSNEIDPYSIDNHRTILEAYKPFREMEYAYSCADSLRWLSVSGIPIIGPDGKFKGYRGVGREITCRKQHEQKIAFLASHDPMTSLPNRRVLMDCLEQALCIAERYSSSGALLIFDLDQFKLINDTYGHPAGDQLLVEVGSRLTPLIRSTDCLARFGGDEFALLLSSVISPVDVANFVGRLLTIINQSVTFDGVEFSVSASIGIAVFPSDGKTSDELIRNADRALYRAKNGGRGCYRFYEQHLDYEIHHRKRLEADLQQGVSGNQLVLHYQPQFDLATNRMVAVEALVRWNYPGRGLLMPASFIPLAETSDLIHLVGGWVLDEACRQARIWHDQGNKLRVAVNLSQAQLCHPRLLDRVDQALMNSGSNGSWLELEITESLMMERLDAVVAQNLSGLAERGIPLALDDFGTGYSSLAQLSQLNVGKIKIDRSFIAQIGENEQDNILTRLIIHIGHSLKMTLVAEGVETQAQLQFLRQAGCQEVQGYFCGRPVPANEIGTSIKFDLMEPLETAIPAS